MQEKMLTCSCAILLTNLVAEIHLSVFIPAFIDILPQLKPPIEFKKHSVPLTLALKCDILASEPYSEAISRVA